MEGLGCFFPPPSAVYIVRETATFKAEVRASADGNFYGQALAIRLDYNKQCNLVICLMQTGRLVEAKSLLRIVPKPSSNYNAESYLRSFDRAFEMLEELEKQSTPHAKKEEIKQVESTTPSANVPTLLNENSSPSASIYFTPQSAFRRGRWIQYDESFPSADR